VTTRRRSARTARTTKAPLDWATVADVTFPDLLPAVATVLEPDDRHDGVHFDAVAFGDVAADDAEFLDCRLSGCTVDDGRMRRARLSTCLLDDVRISALDVADSTWEGVAVRHSRFGALVAHGATLERVTVDHVRLDYVNLRQASLERVQFLDCRIGELDLGTATLTEVRFTGCDVERLVLGGATLADVDLRGVELTTLEGVAGLSGARISEGQLSLLAPALAAHLGILVGAPDPDESPVGS
jgi:uncharacterized protein YjbI with pentapeptide repeats